MSNATNARIIYNSLSKDYLLVCAGANGGLYSRKIGANNQPLQSSETLSSSGDFTQSTYSVSYAPITHTKTPNGRYLLVTGGCDHTMLDSDGKPLTTFYKNWDPNQPIGAYIPFNWGSGSGRHDYHVSFEYTSGLPGFLVVWSDHDKEYDYFQTNFGDPD